MISAATRVLRLAFVSNTATKPTLADDPLIDFVAYARDSVLTGTLRLDANRLTDLLNGSDELDLVEVLRFGLDGSIVEADRAVVKCADLIAVKAGLPRGSKTLRHPTRQSAVAAGGGPYLMHGYIHGRPGADPMIHLGRRPPMVPLTDATIAYQTARGWKRDDASTLIINRDAADWLRPAREDEGTHLGRRSGAA
jgi:hypothetical protein